MTARDVPDLAHGDAPDSFDAPDGRTYSGPVTAPETTPERAAYEAAAAWAAEVGGPGLLTPWDKLGDRDHACWHRAAQAAIDVFLAGNSVSAESIREALAAQEAKPAPELAAAMTETRIVRHVLASVFGSFSTPDSRRMRHASVTASTIERWKNDAGLPPVEGK